MSQATPLIEVKNVHLQFGGLKALNDVSFHVAPRTITSIIGPNGAGKTTMFNCISGFYRPTGGAIVLHRNGHAIPLQKLVGEKIVNADYVRPDRLLSKIYYQWFGGSHLVAANGLARTFQNNRLFTEMTVLENLLVAQHRLVNRNLISGMLNLPSYRRSENAAIDRAVNWLKRLNLLEHANRSAGELAYGLQKRLEIARALCTGAHIICLDEPAAGLNHNETKELSDFLVKLKNEHNVTILLIEHDMSLVMKISDHIVVLDHGEVIAEGNPEVIKTHPAVLKAYLGEEAEV